MVYLYAGLGIAMMVGIVSVFETAILFDQVQLQWIAPDAGRPDAFAGSDRDAYLASIGSVQGSPPSDCAELPLKLNLAADYVSLGASGSFPCVFEKPEVASSRVWMHRILIDSNGAYWSCIFDQAKPVSNANPRFCPFE